MVLDVISNNSFRILGVFANSSKKEILSNKSRFNAFIRVNQPIPILSYDMSNILPVVIRDLDAIDKAESEISISKGRLTQCLFWFVRTGDEDDGALDLLSKGDFDTPIRMWKKDGTVSSLHNIMVTHMMANRYREALLLAHNIFSVHFDEWRNMLSLLPDISSSDVSHHYLETLYQENPSGLSSIDWNGMPKEWEQYVKGKASKPIVDRIESFVEICKKSNDEHPEAQYQAGNTLLDNAQPLLKELESLLRPDDITLQSTEDKVFSEVLNCSISSYNYAYDRLNNGDTTLYRQIAPQCNNLVNRINPTFVSATLATRITENKKTINEKCIDIEKTIERALNIMISCPECGEDSSSIKHYTMIRWALFLFVAAQTQRVTYTCCPKCMRKHILWHGFTYNIITGNILWLILILPWSLILLIMSFTKGHSSSVLSMIGKE